MRKGPNLERWKRVIFRNPAPDSQKGLPFRRDRDMPEELCLSFPLLSIPLSWTKARWLMRASTGASERCFCCS